MAPTTTLGFLALAILGTVGTVVGFRGFLEVMASHADQPIPEDVNRWRWTRELLFPYGLLTLVFGLVGVVGDIGLIFYLVSRM